MWNTFILTLEPSYHIDHPGVYDYEWLFPLIAVTFSIFYTTVARVLGVKLSAL